ncbi:MAG: retroviral-like aspartic protease family protein [Oscillospiraceae bacterium]|nr:retroviral-like aspartic protease family protein [Oscillospiraceae bacterium]
MSNSNIVKLHMHNGVPMIDFYLWDRNKSVYRNTLAILDTGASVTTVCKDLLNALGYENDTASAKRKAATASGMENVSEVMVHKIRMGNVVFSDVIIQGHDFPQDSYAVAVVGMNVLKYFDIRLSFNGNEATFERI